MTSLKTTLGDLLTIYFWTVTISEIGKCSWYWVQSFNSLMMSMTAYHVDWWRVIPNNLNGIFKGYTLLIFRVVVTFWHALFGMHNLECDFS